MRMRDKFKTNSLGRFPREKIIKWNPAALLFHLSWSWNPWVDAAPPAVGKEAIHVLNLNFLILKQSGLETQVFLVLLRRTSGSSMKYIHFIIPEFHIFTLLHKRVKMYWKKLKKQQPGLPFLNCKWIWQRIDVQWFWLNHSLNHSLPDNQSFQKTCSGNGRVCWCGECVRDRQPL